MNPRQTPSRSPETGADYPTQSVLALSESPPATAQGSSANEGEKVFEPETLAAFIARVQAAPPPTATEVPGTASLAERMARLTQQHHAILTDLFGPDAI